MNSPERVRRGRPPKDGARRPLTKETIGAAAVAVAGAEGFRALTMRRLASELGVTVRALYNVIADRQEAIDLAAAHLIASLPEHHYDPERWRQSIRDWYLAGRAGYRPLARALLISMEETVTAAAVPVERILSPERMLRFLTDIGLSAQQASAVRGHMLLDLFAFSLLIDHQWDTTPEELRPLMFEPVPKPWLEANPDVSAPISRELADAGTPTTPDDVLDAVADRTIAYIESLLR
ncbi:TetR family transcriptional regulator [Gordonia pseudamarae]|uniref:TetR family transcriptional regulator n=1 Tax=Gordonia pseudamarae TaxID=2831662 RepID=A0ABX6IHH8_9ACTN|nr:MULTISPECIES: TetR family transcriptional regulator [Gordonia]MBD0021397.1 TetR family transcriptional regulator [Gordonia sp. (in: high G+C Gram-positive bacteria)]QHN26433.1 TetR family transcriptional regulator [Gordonia pseudamarae]QHN35328.1 TetR family transcriptional regulator [Gordonia pseudamarae]